MKIIGLIQSLRFLHAVGPEARNAKQFRQEIPKSNYLS
jgi:hypothetical protein